jgi:hypothetical protein
MPGQTVDRSKTYLKIIGGNIVQEVDKDNPDARKREYETSDGKKGVKYELVYMNWTGKIIDISFKETTFGEICNVKMEDATLSMPVTGRYFQDFACKVFNADLSQPVTLHPYDIETDTGRKTGISFQQNGDKLSNYFYDFDKKEKLHGFPEVDKKKSEKKTYWKIYFIEVQEFLTEKLKELAQTSFIVRPVEAEADQTEPLKDNEIMPEDVDNELPF